MAIDLAIDKVQIMRKIIDELEGLTGELRTGFEEARRASIEAPGRMQSRYDTMGVEAAWVADGLAESLRQNLEALSKLRALRLPDAPKSVGVGCLVGLGSDRDVVERLYFILPVAGGITVPLEGGTLCLQSVTSHAPIARALIGKSIHQQVEFRKGTRTPEIITFLV